MVSNVKTLNTEVHMPRPRIWQDMMEHAQDICPGYVQDMHGIFNDSGGHVVVGIEAR